MQKQRSKRQERMDREYRLLLSVHPRKRCAWAWSGCTARAVTTAVGASGKPEPACQACADTMGRKHAAEIAQILSQPFRTALAHAAGLRATPTRAKLLRMIKMLLEGHRRTR